MHDTLFDRKDGYVDDWVSQRVCGCVDKDILVLKNVCHEVHWSNLLFRLRFGMDKEEVYALC